MISSFNNCWLNKGLTQWENSYIAWGLAPLGQPIQMGLMDNQFKWGLAPRILTGIYRF